MSQNDFLESYGIYNAVHWCLTDNMSLRSFVLQTAFHHCGHKYKVSFMYVQ